MMVLDLQCTHAHCFEGWFSNSEAFLRQKEAGEIRCPVCDDHHVTQALSPVAIKRAYRPQPEEDRDEVPGKLIKDFYRYIEKNFEEVGTEFAKEALKIHYGVGEKRNIRGTSTEEEEKVLKEEGVAFHKIPFPKGGQ
ncbi:MAG: DUF1178 family protein [Thermodesulfobacteriota bacterium]